MTFDLSANVHLGRPLSVHGLALVPLFPASSPLVFADLAQAVEAGLAEVEEEAAPTIPTVQVHNRGPQPVLVAEGTLLVGGRQDRLCQKPQWLPPGSRGEVSVHCVEASRWKEHRPGARSFRAHRADVGLRHARMRESADQPRTWQLVAQRRRRAGLADGSGSVHEVREHLGVERLAADMLLPWGATGVVVAWAHAGVSRFPLIEWSASPAAFRAAWPALARGVLDSHLDRRRNEGSGRQAPWVQLGDIAQLLAKVDQPAEAHREPAGPDAVAVHFRRGCMVGWATQVAGRLAHVGAVRV